MMREVFNYFEDTCEIKYKKLDCYIVVLGSANNHIMWNMGLQSMIIENFI